MPVNGVSGSSSSSSTSKSKNQMTSTDFLNVMIQQLQHQDPLDPTDSNALLTQMSQISQLQSSTELKETLSDNALKQSIGSASNLIGGYCVGIDASGKKIEGYVKSVSVQNKSVYLEMESGDELPVENLTEVHASKPTTATAA